MLRFGIQLGIGSNTGLQEENLGVLAWLIDENNETSYHLSNNESSLQYLVIT
jgi:hypothetical protein